MDLSVVVINWKSGRFLTPLLNSLAPLAREWEELLIVDNASGETPPAQLAELPKTHWIEAPHNLGFAGAANLGVKQTRSKFFLLLNPDVQIEPDSVRALYEEIEARPQAAVVCGPLLGEQGTPQRFQLRPLPTPVDVFLEALFLRRLLKTRPPEVSPAGGEVISVEQPAAAYWMVRRKAWDSLGGMDERFYPAWFEDVDFCRRARDSNWNLFYCPHCPARHHGGASLEALGRTRFYQIYYRNLLRYLRKHHPRSYPWLWLPVKFGSVVRQVIGPGAAGHTRS